MKDYIEEYVDINGIKQYFLHYPCESDYVLLCLHGGPGQTEAQFAYYSKDERLKCNVVYYDQRGAGRTQLRNKTKPGDITTDRLMEDLKETILYLKKKYNTEKIILLGHSWGSVLGTLYVKKNPTDVICYIGTGQVIDIKKGEKVAYDKLEQVIREAKNSKDLKAFSRYEGYPYNVSEESFTKTISGFRKLQGKYGLAADMKPAIKIFYKSPVFHVKDLYALLASLKANKKQLKR
jgi:pimeloyl-ACP methyl ester carboxylesterase